LIIDEELRRAGVRRPQFSLSRGYVGPLILDLGTPEQIERFLRPMLTGDEVWCQLFSEPEAGSDLASLTTSATRDGSQYSVNGVKIWTSQAHLAQFGLLLARTSSDRPKHNGLSLFICPMDSAGMTLQPIHNMEGERKWNMVYFSDVRLPADYLVGTENEGWYAAQRVLSNERMQMSAEQGLAWGKGPSYEDLLKYAQARSVGGRLPDHLISRVAEGYIQAVALHVMRMKALGGGEGLPLTTIAPEARRALADSHGQQMLEVWRDLHGSAGVALSPVGEEEAKPFVDNYFYARALTIGGGTAEIQRNILAERVLGLPR
jgi:alkylation response protein AidB-like acyl-CoA dehydrogenase